MKPSSRIRCTAAVPALALALAAVVAFTTTAHGVVVLDETFDTPPHTLDASPNGVNGWSVTDDSATQTVLVIDEYQSPFFDAGDDRAVRIDDNDNTGGLFSPKLNRAFAFASDETIDLRFDYKMLTSQDSPTFHLRSGGTTAINFQLGFPAGGGPEISYTDTSNTRHVLEDGDSGINADWFRFILSIDPLNQAVDSWDLRIIRHDGTIVVSDNTYTNLAFRNNVASADSVRWLFNVPAGSSNGDFVLDNIVVGVPTPAAGLAGALLLAPVLARRRRR